jgi:hypothetical protein
VLWKDKRRKCPLKPELESHNKDQRSPHMTSSRRQLKSVTTCQIRDRIAHSDFWYWVTFHSFVEAFSYLFSSKSKSIVTSGYHKTNAKDNAV